MYHPMLFVHWKQAKFLLIPFVVAAFGLPLLVVQGYGWGAGVELGLEAYRILAAYEVWLPLFPLLAASIGAVIALTAWNWDHRYGHVHALSLPVARWEYAAMKMGAGAALVLVPSAALWIGAHLASASIALPDGLRAYPNLLAFRFFLATLVSYALFFALGAGTIRTTMWVVSAVVGLVVGGELVRGVLAMVAPSMDLDVMTNALLWVMRAGGPFAVFTGNWALIDV
ncbi:MAG: hypothetical protein FJ207_09490 [Gemmatimonadetes bacterium]|nr:hypothetical protein [Gemmatimonadota bacterium]